MKKGECGNKIVDKNWERGLTWLIFMISTEMSGC